MGLRFGVRFFGVEQVGCPSGSLLGVTLAQWQPAGSSRLACRMSAESCRWADGGTLLGSEDSDGMVAAVGGALRRRILAPKLKGDADRTNQQVSQPRVAATSEAELAWLGTTSPASF